MFDSRQTVLYLEPDIVFRRNEEGRGGGIDCRSEFRLYLSAQTFAIYLTESCLVAQKGLCKVFAVPCGCQGGIPTSIFLRKEDLPKPVRWKNYCKTVAMGPTILCYRQRYNMTSLHSSGCLYTRAVALLGVYDKFPSMWRMKCGTPLKSETY